MASLSSVSSGSNTVSSLMNSANMISGLASGLDTESMIESLVQSYSTKINQLNQKVTKVEWKQDAYRSIISKMVGFSNKYTSYTSSTNLMSSSFFSSAIKVLAKGAFADSVNASGKTGSDVQLNAVRQLAASAQYRTKSNLPTTEAGVIAASDGVDLSVDAERDIELSNLQGSLTLTYGTKNVSISFNESTDVDTMKDIRARLSSEQGISEESVSDSEVLAELINQKLADQNIAFTNGNSESANQRIQATAYGGSIRFSEIGNGHNGVYISKTSGNIAEQLGIDTDALKNASESKLTTLDTSNITGSNGTTGLTRKLNSFEYLVEKSSESGSTGLTMNVALDGTTKQIKMPRLGYEKDEDGNETYYVNGEATTKEDLANKYTEALQESLKKEFKNKVTVENKGENGELKLEFKATDEGSSLVINSGAGEALGIGKTATSYLNTSKTLKELLGDQLGTLSPAKKEDEFGVEVLDVDEKTGKQKYEFKLNDVVIGTYTEDAKLSDILSDINSNKEAGVKVSYSQTTQSFTFTATETGSDSEIKISGGMAEMIFGPTEPEDKSGSSFAEAYGCDWLRDGDKLTFTIPGDSEYTCAMTKDDSISDVVDKLNSSPIGSDHTFSYNKYTGQIEAKDKNGASVEFKIENEWGSEVEFDSSKAPNIDYTAGQDAKFTITVNGETINMTRGSNTVDIDGLSITMKNTFDATVDEDGNSLSAAEIKARSVTFENQTDSDKIIDAIKSMVDDYNAMMNEIKSAYSTMPYQKSDGSFAGYEPLTDEEREGMSESAIERYEEKAKQGILFGDRNLSNLYTKMTQAFSFASQNDINALKDMGISIGYNISGGEQAITIDEDKLRAMLDSDPDRVADLFTKTDGIMDRMKTQLDAYAKTTGEPKGILIQQAGSPLSSLSLMNNQWQTEIDNYNTQIEKWQDKLTSQVERYTSQFSRLELLIQQMNSQSATLAGMMGG